ncbi:hypothetical protein DV736_g814, partial [Chaetothyriales sp. CBS 134916]
MSDSGTHDPLQGTCSCGRNHISITLPRDAVTAGRQAQIYFDDSRPSHFPTPVLRVPLTWVSSATIALFPDETHTTIRRTFTPASAPHVKQVFCGYCGTHISRWSEQPRSEADFLSVMLSTLGSRGLGRLEELDLLQTAEEAVVPTTRTRTRQGRVGALDWYEELIEGSRLGRTLQTRRGVGTTADGSTAVQWEVSEWTEADDEAAPKRKAGEIEGDDVGMTAMGVHETARDGPRQL